MIACQSESRVFEVVKDGRRLKNRTENVLSQTTENRNTVTTPTVSRKLQWQIEPYHRSNQTVGIAIT